MALAHWNEHATKRRWGDKNENKNNVNPTGWNRKQDERMEEKRKKKLIFLKAKFLIS